MSTLKIRLTRCGEQEPFYTFEASTVDEAVNHIRGKYNRFNCTERDFFVTFGESDVLLYKTWYGSFMVWYGSGWVDVFNLKCYFVK